MSEVDRPGPTDNAVSQSQILSGTDIGTKHTDGKKKAMTHWVNIEVGYSNFQAVLPCSSRTYLPSTSLTNVDGGTGL